MAAPERAAALAAEAALTAMDRLAYEQSAGWYRRALEAEEIIEPPDPARRADLLIGLVLARNEAGEASDARADAATAAELARRVGDGTLLARAAISYGGQYGAWLAYDDTLGLALAAEALAAIDASNLAMRAQLHLAESGWLRLAVDADQRNSAVHEAARLAAGVDDPVLAFRVLDERMELARDALDPAEHLAIAEHLEELSFQTPVTRGLALYTRMFHVGRTGDLTALAELVRAMADLADETGHALRDG